MKLYRIALNLSSRPLYIHVDEAEAFDVCGQLYADAYGGSLLQRADGKWHETKAAAAEAAAKEIEEAAARLTAQAAKLREEIQA